MQGHIHKRVRTCKNGRKSTLWYVVADLPPGSNGERRQKWHGGFRTKKAAEAVRARLIHELTTGFYVEPSRMLLSEWLVDRWLPVHKTRVKKTTYRAYRSAIVHHVNPRLGGVAIGKLTAQMLSGLYQQLLADGRCDGDGGLAPATVANKHVVLRKALADAEDAGLIPRNPAEKAKPPRPKSQGGELRYWTPGELREFLSLVEGHRLEAAFHLLAMTGARRGEVAGLRWVDVDFDGARITIRQALLNGDGEVYVSSPKSGRGRTVDLDQATVAKLREHRERQLAEAVETWRWKDSGYVFTRKDGSALNPSTLTRAFRWIVDRSELPRIRLHDLRHTHASIAVKAGVPIGVVSERLGHASPEFTLHRYSHVMPGMQREAADTIAGAVRFDGAAGCPTVFPNRERFSVSEYQACSYSHLQCTNTCSIRSYEKGTRMSKPDPEAGSRTDARSITLEDAMARLMRSERPKDPAAVLDALTFADPTIKQAMNGAGKFIDHEELLRRLEDQS